MLKMPKLVKSCNASRSDKHQCTEPMKPQQDAQLPLSSPWQISRLSISAHHSTKHRQGGTQRQSMYLIPLQYTCQLSRITLKYLFLELLSLVDVRCKCATKAQYISIRRNALQRLENLTDSAKCIIPDSHQALQFQLCASLFKLFLFPWCFDRLVAFCILIVSIMQRFL